LNSACCCSIWKKDQGRRGSGSAGSMHGCVASLDRFQPQPILAGSLRHLLTYITYSGKTGANVIDIHQFPGRQCRVVNIHDVKKARKAKCPRSREQPFPWRCRHCGKTEVTLAKTSYDAEVRHDGRLHTFTIADLELPVCQACGERVFTEKVDAQVNDALRAHLNLLTPVQIRDAIKRVGMPQNDIERDTHRRSPQPERTNNRFPPKRGPHESREETRQP